MQLADLLGQTSLIIYNEVPMQYRYCFEVVNQTFNYICNAFENALFENISILLGIVFAQIASVVPRSNRAATMPASLQSSFLWPHFQILHLTLNILVQAGLNIISFASWLHEISYKPILIGILSLPSYIQAYTQPEDLIHFVYLTKILVTTLQDIQVFAKRYILIFHNYTVNQFNHQQKKICVRTQECVWCVMCVRSIRLRPVASRMLHMCHTSSSASPTMPSVKCIKSQKNILIHYLAYKVL